MMIKNLIIKSSRGSYPVAFEKTLSNYQFHPNNNLHHLVVADADVWKLHGHKLPSLSDLPRYEIPATEYSKTLDSVDRLCDWLILNGATKTSNLIGFGGGVIQDLVTFTASIFHRGCAWEYFPTTLLSQADSCIGSKCGINVSQYKNQIGTIYAPSRVIVVKDFLNTLPMSEIHSGFGEIFKLAIIGPGQFYSQLKLILGNQKALPSGDELQNLIYLSLMSKKYIIEEDEHELGVRRVLNYGHSFGHAIEALSNYEISHGLGVIFGMDLINYIGMRKGVTQPEFYYDFKSLISRYFCKCLPSTQIDAKSLVERLYADKKMAYGKINFAIPKSPGDIKVIENKLDLDLVRLVEEYLEGECDLFID